MRYVLLLVLIMTVAGCVDDTSNPVEVMCLDVPQNRNEDVWVDDVRDCDLIKIEGIQCDIIVDPCNSYESNQVERYLTYKDFYRQETHYKSSMTISGLNHIKLQNKTTKESALMEILLFMEKNELPCYSRMKNDN